MREPSPSLSTASASSTTSTPRATATALALLLVPAAVITAIMALVLAVAPRVGDAGKEALYHAALLANVAVWFAFAPPYLIGWVRFWDPSLRARVGALGVAALAGVLWFVNLFVYALGCHLLAALRG